MSGSELSKESKENLESIGKKIGVKDMVALNDFIDASIYTAFDFTLAALMERIQALEAQVAEALRQLQQAKLAAEQVPENETQVLNKVSSDAAHALCANICISDIA